MPGGGRLAKKMGSKMIKGGGDQKKLGIGWGAIYFFKSYRAYR